MFDLYFAQLRDFEDEAMVINLDILKGSSA
jgi:hypothetical protein